ncbi:phosphohistidine phosphatase SixA [Cricetibacter osteomyelitidis]|uniref:Phosphohistidine phosphatase SixA n=1 Tax=Cricetibacter osteomyelitidis TaxID=1521931 RepID=A0A4R2SWY1_9PAST|nr:phosphohistidine phosphatase SixA [Cricetibacter osteomyelitidis]TCP94997.1 phosphohistidine phosphatase SixA [Cricetibacter osteomyelitidis]
MKIFIMRHGEAELIVTTDSARHLTPQGKAQSSTQGKKLKATNIVFDRILVSPYVRAQETFDEVNTAFGGTLNEQKEIWDELTPYGDSALVKDYLTVLAEQQVNNVLIVSHLPLVGDIAYELCHGRTAMNFYTAAIALIEWDGVKGELAEAYYPA